MTNKLPLILGLLLTTACGEKEPEPSAEPSGEPATEPAGEPSDEIVDEDGDGVAEADDCDDTNADLGAIADDADCDGVATADDCDDDDADWGLPTDEVCDGIDNNCDGTVDEGVTTTYYVDLDADGLGFDGVLTEEACEAPDGYVDNANDCDDADADIGDAPDEDGDGFMACFDCDDADAMTYPGAAEMDSESACMTDADEDGYGDANAGVTDCLTIELFDSYGDSSFGGTLTVTADGEELEINESLEDCTDASLCDLVGTGWSGGPSSYSSQEVCYTGASEVVVSYEAPSYFASEDGYRITSQDGTVLAEEGFIVGAEAADMSWTFESAVATGTDCDDSDAGVGTGDSDGDGFDACNTENPNDCDDTDAAINPSVDADADGFSVCDECDDSNADIHPDATEVWYDGIDQDCDGMSDYDADMDGYDAMEYDDGTGTMVEYTGTDCDDSDDDLHPADMEADPDQCFQDKDDDGYGDMDLTDAEIAAGVIAGTDCYDSSYGGATTYPGAGFNETGDLATACVEDGDMDGYGDMSPSTSYDITAGTDCNDSDETISPAVDGDSDGVNYCVDCDDDDSTNTAQQFEAFNDIDGDGYGSTSVWTCSLDTDDDGTDDLVVMGGDCWDSSSTWSGDSSVAYPGAASNETGTNEDGIALSTLCLADADGDGLGDADAYYMVDEDGTDCDDDDADAGVGVWAYDDADEDGFGDDDTFDYVCSLDSDDDGKNDMVEVGGDCDDTPATVDSATEEVTDVGGSMTYPGAAEMDSTEECLTDNDDDGYGADNTIAGLYEQAVTAGDTIDITIDDSWGDGCEGYVDVYVDYVLEASYIGPATTTVSHTHTVVSTGTMQVGWTSPSSYNSECSFGLFDSAGTSLYDSGSDPDATVPMMGTGSDSDDSDASVQ